MIEKIADEYPKINERHQGPRFLDAPIDQGSKELCSSIVDIDDVGLNQYEDIFEASLCSRSARDEKRL
jgi:hypothetical protein